jgi:hypothetical protein
MTAPARTETGGPTTRTPRSEITAAVSASRKKEPVLLLDLSGSMDWEAAPGAPEWNSGTRSGGRRGVVIEAIHGLVSALEDEDSEAAARTTTARCGPIRWQPSAIRRRTSTARVTSGSCRSTP